jgi:hypothetical protein
MADRTRRDPAAKLPPRMTPISQLPGRENFRSPSSLGQDLTATSWATLGTSRVGASRVHTWSVTQR